MTIDITRDIPRDTRDLTRHNRPVADSLHRHVWQAMVGLTVWFVISAWLLFGGGLDSDLSLLMLTTFFVMAMGIPLALWLVWWRKGPGADRARNASLRDWMHGDFATQQYRLSGTDAAIQILLPIAAGAFGLTAFGLVLYFTTGA